MGIRETILQPAEQMGPADANRVIGQMSLERNGVALPGAYIDYGIAAGDPSAIDYADAMLERLIHIGDCIEPPEELYGRVLRAAMPDYRYRAGGDEPSEADHAISQLTLGRLLESVVHDRVIGLTDDQRSSSMIALTGLLMVPHAYISGPREGGFWLARRRLNAGQVFQDTASDPYDYRSDQLVRFGHDAYIGGPAGGDFNKRAAFHFRGHNKARGASVVSADPSVRTVYVTDDIVNLLYSPKFDNVALQPFEVTRVRKHNGRISLAAEERQACLTLGASILARHAQREELSGDEIAFMGSVRKHMQDLSMVTTSSCK